MPRRIRPRVASEELSLFPHAAGPWAKVILSKQRYFGKWRDGQANNESVGETIAAEREKGTVHREPEQRGLVLPEC